ncbi:histidine ammonia-lyase [Acidicapsa dinghuensis]|uniref:Histidine ammonia-lyase n=1 Tax=Acidicapsa dinghuensis TaxID=2218256 RepID=A0ABW1EL85_9BACT|nr:histidine ammonia-lyase [Acidicapsa dinghuensis]
MTPTSGSALAIDGSPLKLSEIETIANGFSKVTLMPAARERVKASRTVIESILASGETVYGVNTGFGKLADVRIPAEHLADLQTNLVRSHAAGVGEPLSEAESRAMLLLRANVLAKGCSGVRPEILDLLLAMLNAGVHPVIPARGSVGASGDLAPLSHLALVLIGEGEAIYRGQRISGAQALSLAGLSPVQLAAKEGLALLNGTQAMTAVGALTTRYAQCLAAIADLAGAMSLEALKGTPAAFDSRIHAARPHPGQIASAANLERLLENSSIRESHRSAAVDSRVQDAYCLRCMPQVHGAVRGVLDHVAHILEVESGSATDNPLIFANSGATLPKVVSGGNFHGAPLSYAFDYASIALTDLASISERRIDRLINPDINEGLPAFLTANAGLSSGYMIAHVTAAALLNECKVLAHPSSTDSVPTSGGKEDHVSMGMTGALKLRQIVDNLEKILAIEILCAAQGLDFRLPLRPGPAVAEAHTRIRALVPHLNEDRSPAPDIEAISKAIRNGQLTE